MYMSECVLTSSWALLALSSSLLDFLRASGPTTDRTFRSLSSQKKKKDNQFNRGLNWVGVQRHDQTICDPPLPSVSWSLSKQRDRLSQCSEASFHLGIICRDGYLSGSSATLKRSESFLLPFTDTIFQFQSLPWLNAMEKKKQSHMTAYTSP